MTKLKYIIFLLILLFVIVLVLILVGAEYKKEDSEKSKREKDEEEELENYLDYKNEQWEFEIKYPKDWEKQEETADIGFTVGFLTPQEGSDDPTGENIRVFVSMPRQQDLDDLMAQAMEEISKDPNTNLTDYSKVIISGYPGYKLSYSYVDYYSGKLQYVHYLINAGDKWYQVLFIALESTYPQYLPQAQAMIDSLVIK